MSYDTQSYIINNITLPLNASYMEAFNIARKRLICSGIVCDNAEFSIYRRSIDARKKQDIRLVYSVLVCGCLSIISDETCKKNGIVLHRYSPPKFEIGEQSIRSNIIVVGSGPCGLFAALMLAENGYRPLLIERGGSVAERTKRVERFKKERKLDTSTNIQFGAGGAGTFSDGKLVTRINDSLSAYVLRRFVEFGAPGEILYNAKPHVGTDVLSTVVDNVIDRIKLLGGDVLYHTCLRDFVTSGQYIRRIITDNGEFDCDALILAIGHSARDTYATLINKGCDIVAKPFSVGMRIEHSAEMIDKGMYGDFAGNPILGHAEYTLSYNTKERGVYTFCMCPGGTIVPAASEEGGVVVNGMSCHARNGKNSNSAVCCSIFKEDFGNTPQLAIDFQRKIERAAFVAGGSDYSAPIITVGDFLNDRLENEPTDIRPTYMDGIGVKLANPSDFLPKKIIDLLKRGINDFDKKISGFACPSAILTGAETRTSSPLRILRNIDSCLATGYDNLYPAGEGAGYAGGITSAAIDGIKTAAAVMQRFKP